MVHEFCRFLKRRREALHNQSALHNPSNHHEVRWHASDSVAPRAGACKCDGVESIGPIFPEELASRACCCPSCCSRIVLTSVVDIGSARLRH